VKIREVIKPVAPVGVADAQSEALKQIEADVRKRKAMTRVTKARERLTQAQQSQSDLQNKST
jgi:hypothetical protein